MEISNELQRFYRELQEFIERDFADPPIWFRVNQGLCNNLEWWCYTTERGNYVQLHQEQRNIFLAEGLHPKFPFNGGIPQNYRTEKYHWTNPARLAFVKKYAAKGPK